MRNAQPHLAPRARTGRFLALAIALTLITPLALAAHQEPTQEQEEELSELRRGAVPMGTPGLVAPTLLTTELPEYTEESKRAGIEGDIYIEAVVTKDGTIAEPKLIRALPDDELNRRALAAIAEWTFKSGTMDDKPVDVIALLTVTFRNR